MSEARDAQLYFELSPPGKGSIIGGALVIALALGAEISTQNWRPSFVVAVVGMHLILRGLGQRRNPAPRITLSELGIRDARVLREPIAWELVKTTSRKTTPRGEALVVEVRDGREIEILASDFKKHDFDRMQSFSMLYKQRYG